MDTTIGSTKLDIHIVIETTPGTEGHLNLSSRTRIEVDDKPIGFVNRMRIDATSEEVLPAIDIEMLSGQVLDDLDPLAQANVNAMFEALRKCPGVKARLCRSYRNG